LKVIKSIFLVLFLCLPLQAANEWYCDGSLDPGDVNNAGTQGDPVIKQPYAIYEDDTEGNPHPGVCVGGTMTLTVANAEDASMTGIDITIYYIDTWLQ
jgi:hypothetical protein